MINKKNLWFLTLFSLILVLSIYYVTMPSELLMSNNDVNEIKNDTNDINEANIIETLRLEDDTTTLENITELKTLLTKTDTSIAEKNEAFETLRILNQISSKEELLEEKIKNNFNLDSFVKIEEDKVRIVISSDSHDNTLANNIMKLAQEEFDKKMYISVQFK